MLSIRYPAQSAGAVEFTVCWGIRPPTIRVLNMTLNRIWLFIIRPTNAQKWHKAVFKVGPVAGPKPTRIRQGQKYLRPRRHSPFWRKAINLTPPKRVKACGRRNSPVPSHTRQNRPEVWQPTECNPTTGEERSEDLWCWSSSSGGLGNVECLFITITPRSTLTQNGSTC